MKEPVLVFNENPYDLKPHCFGFYLGNEENMDTTEPLAQPLFDDVAELASDTRGAERGNRKNRLAALASSINNWEDDLSHPNIRPAEEPKRKVWKAPTAASTAPPASGLHLVLLLPSTRD